jgi:hypothetical protein
MEEPIRMAVKHNPTKVATKWALIYLATAIVFTYAFEFLNIDQTSSWKYISYIPFFGFLLLTQKEFRDQIGGFMTFGQGFSAGFRYSVFSGLLIGIFTYVYFAFLSPHVYGKLLETIQTGLEQKNNMSEEQIDKAMGFYKGPWGLAIMGFGAAIGMTVFGAVVSLIGAAIFKKERSAYDIVEDAIDPTV